MSSVTSASNVERRVLLLGVLILIAFAGAGLAVAVDRPHVDAFRPELTARADTRFAQWRQGLVAELGGAAEQLGLVSVEGREVVGSLYRQQLEEVTAALARGRAAAVAIDERRAAILQLRVQQAAAVPDARLGAANRAFVSAVDDAAGALAAVPGSWAALEAIVGTVVDLVAAIDEHDGAVALAASAGRSSLWSQALSRMTAARAALDRADAVRDTLAATADVTTLDDLLARYAAYDAALIRLYETLADGAEPTSPQVIAQREDVELASSRLPRDRAAMIVAVAGAAGSAPIDVLGRIEEARGLVDEALALGR